MAPAKKVPMRQCMGCMQSREKKNLIRVLRTTEEEIVLDPTGRKNGRGAYLCRNPECLKKAKKHGSLERALKVPVPDEVYERLAEEMAGIQEEA